MLNEIKSLLGRRAPIEKKSTAALGTSDSLGAFLIFGDGSPATAQGATQLYKKSTAVSIPINYIADTFASIDPVIKVGDEFIDKHPVLDLLKKPSPFFTQRLFMQMIAKEYLITGEEYIVGIGNLNVPPVELMPISSKNITVTQGSNGQAKTMSISDQTMPGAYQLVEEKRMARYIRDPLTEVFQVRNYSTRDNSLLRGESLLVSAASEARQHILGGQHNVSLLNNGGKISLLFHYEEDLDEDDFIKLKQRINDQYAGTANTGNIGVTTGGKVSVDELGINNKDMDFFNLQQVAQKSVALQYKFPLPLLTTDASTRDNFKTSKLSLFDDAVLPLADVIFGGLTEFLMPRYGLDPTQIIITYNPNTILPLADRTLDHVIKIASLGVETDNEIRERIGQEEYEGGDVVYKPANLIPVGTDVFGDDLDEEDDEVTLGA